MNVQAQSDNLAAKRRLPFEVVALVLQGGGALGAYQAGVYEALSEAGIHPNWISGVSIGAIMPLSLQVIRQIRGLIVCAISGRRSPRMDHGRGRAMHVSASRRVSPCAN